MGLRSLFILLFITTCLIGTALPKASAAARNELEYKLKAAFLLNFAKFTSWPKTSDIQSSFHLCILGGNEMKSALHGLEEKSVAGEPVHLRLLEEVQPAGECRLLFISSSEKTDIASISNTIPAQPILLVSDIEGSAAEGGIIEFIYLENRLRFIINHTEAKRRGLEISSSLLSLAHRVL